MSVIREALKSGNELQKPHQGEEEVAMEQSSSNQITGIFYQTNYCLDGNCFQCLVGKPEFLSIESEASTGRFPNPCLDFLKPKGGENTDSSPVELIDSCNGLLLCYSVDADTFFICNPLTEENVSIPQPSGHYSCLYYALLADFDSAGYLQYKVVCLYNSYTVSKLLVLSSESGEWGEIEGKFPPLLHKVVMGSSVYVNGSLYWDCLEGQILVIHLNLKEDQCCYDLIEAPAAPLGRCLWKYQDKLRCYSHGYSGEYLAWSLFVGEKGEFKWELDGCEEFETVSEDISREISKGWIVHSKSATPRVKFEIIGYRHESKTMFLIAKGNICSYQLSDRVLNVVGRLKYNEFYRGQTNMKRQCCVLPYVHSLAHIQRRNTE